MRLGIRKQQVDFPVTGIAILQHSFAEPVLAQGISSKKKKKNPLSIPILPQVLYFVKGYTFGAARLIVNRAENAEWNQTHSLKLMVPDSVDRNMETRLNIPPKLFKRNRCMKGMFLRLLQASFFL